MTPKQIATIFKTFLDNGDNDMLDGIAAADILARHVAELLPQAEQKTFLKMCRLS